MSCPDETTVARFLQGGLTTAAATTELELHLDRCDACFDLVTELARGSAERMGSDPFLAVPDTMPRGAVLGRYVILHRLGAGGMGVVYAAYDPELERKVAIKLLRPALTASGGAVPSARLLREAQLLARLSHPNVVAIYDVGTVDDQVFITMELVDGETATRWLAERSRSWREILSLFRAAGEGLAAAHRAGLVHRDFKPDNVLVDRGHAHRPRPRITDFGLARGPELAYGPELAPRAEDGPRERGVLTETGAVLGTPAYMSPEQLAGAPADAPSDQFSFCVALYEALYGERPFAGTTIQALATATRLGEIRPQPRGSRVPGWLRKIVVRGLAPAPAARHPSMEQLLAALSFERRVVRVRAGLAVIALVAVGAATAFARPGALPPDVCRGADRHLVGIWDPMRSAAIEGAFAATRAPFAAASWAAIEPALTGYARAWTDMRTAACEATRVHGEQSERLLDVRMACLDGRLAALRAVTDVLASATPETVERVGEVVGGLPAIAGCADIGSLLDTSANPADPPTRERATDIRNRLYRVTALGASGSYVQAQPLLDLALADALRLGYAPVIAEARYQAAFLADQVDDYPAMRAHLFEALWAAEATGNSSFASRIAAALARVIGVELGQPDEGLIWARFARAAATRAGPADAIDVDVEVESALGAIARSKGEWVAALAHLERARELAARSGQPTGELDAEIAQVLQMLGRYDEALARFDQVHREFERVRGAQHPSVAAAAKGRGNALERLGRYDEALVAYQAGATILEAAKGPASLALSALLLDRGNAEMALGASEAAEASYRRALAIKLASRGEDARDVLIVRNSLANLLGETGRLEEALALHTQILEVRRRTLGAEHPDVAMSLSNIGDLLRQLGRHRESLVHHREALSIEDKLQPDHPDNAYDLCGIGEAMIHLGDAPTAIEPLERALDLREKGNVEPKLVAEARYLLGRALWTAGRDRDRARALVATAHQGLADLHSPGKTRLAEIEAWQRTHH